MSVIFAPTVLGEYISISILHAFASLVDPFRQLLPLQGPVLVLHLILYTVSCSSTTYTVSHFSNLFCSIPTPYSTVSCSLLLSCIVQWFIVLPIFPVFRFSPLSHFYCVLFVQYLTFIVACVPLSHIYCVRQIYQNYFALFHLTRMCIVFLCLLFPLFLYSIYCVSLSIYHIYCVFYFPSSYAVFTVSLHISYLLCLLFPLFLCSIYCVSPYLIFTVSSITPVLIQSLLCLSIYNIYCVFYFPCSYTVFTVSLHVHKIILS